MSGQETSGSIRGSIYDHATAGKVADATLIIEGNQIRTVMADSSGNFRTVLPPGRYSIVVQHPDYLSQKRDNVQVSSSKEEIQQFYLEKRNNQLPQVNVRSAAEEQNPLSPFNLQQYAAVFYDPARVATTFAGAAGTNDQANHISVRGTSPNYMQWKIEDVEVVSPNHLENSGTINDRAAINGGGVSMLSAQLLTNSGMRFLPDDALHGNALSGVFDLKFRNGNNERNERLVQLSLLGTDLAIEGPFSRNKSASYLFNLRYSTIGLLSQMGVDFGRERSSFGDFSHVINFPTKRGNVKVFGITGTSGTIFGGVRDSLEALSEKEAQDISFLSWTLIEGVSYLNTLSNSSFIKNVIAFSLKKTERKNELLFSVPGLPEEEETYKQGKLSSLHYYSKRFGNSARVRAGVYLNRYTGSATPGTGADQDKRSMVQDLVQPFVTAGYSVNKWELNGGIHFFMVPSLQFIDPQPRSELKYIFNPRHRLSVSYGHHAQLQPYLLLLSHKENKKLPPGRNRSASLKYSYNFAGSELNGEVFLHQYSGVPVSLKTDYSTYNYFNEQISIPLSATGEGRSYGVQLQYEKHMAGYYILPSLSIYNSVYRMQGEWRKGRYNADYNLAVTAGKEWRLRDPDNFFSIDIRAFRRNGFEETMTDQQDQSHSYRLPAYNRIDLRLSYRRNNPKNSSIIAIDIQNVSNERNTAYLYYDRLTGSTESQYQMGLLPVLSYKIMF